MKLIYLFLLISVIGKSQCETDYSGNSYFSNRTFSQLYQSGDCLEENFTTGFIYVRFERLPNAVQTIRYRYAGENNMNLIGIRQYNLACTHIGNGNIILPGVGSVIVQFQIQTMGIEAFCPWSFCETALSASWGEVTTKCNNDIISTSAVLYSHQNTDRIEVRVSQDLQTWETLINIYPNEGPNSSAMQTIEKQIAFNKPNLWYLKFCEISLDGKTSESEIVPFVNKADMQMLPSYDLSGRLMPAGYLWGVH